MLAPVAVGLSLVATLLLIDDSQDAGGGSRPLPFDTSWTVDKEGAQITRDDGRDVLQVTTGFAHRPDIRFEDGTIDFDVRLTARRSFVYIHFREQRPGEREEFYLRPHKSGLPDAVQYAPVWQNRSAWQLHHGDGGTAAVPFATSRWTHVRVVAKGPSAALFVDDMNKPALLVPHLARGAGAGSISLGGFLPADVPGEGPIATFANVVVTPGRPGFDLETAIRKLPPAPARPSGVISEWLVSSSFLPPAEMSLPDRPSSADRISWSKVTAAADGLVHLDEHIRVPTGSRVTAAIAHVTVRAPQTRIVALELGFSDVATVFLNGRPIFRGDASYSYDRPRRDGLIGLDQARLYLPLQAGDNDLSVLLSDGFGGWGIMGRFVDAGDLSIEAR